MAQLDAYEHYWSTSRNMGHSARKRRMREIREGVDGTWGSADDPLGSHTPMAQDAILRRLGKLAAGRIDDWESLVDPTLSPGENYQLILERGGELPADEKREIRRAIAETVDERERSRAAGLLREHAAAIAAGDREQLADDIAAEYGREFVDETVRAALESIDTAAETPASFGDPAPSAGDTDPEPEPTPSPSAASVETPAADGDAPEPADAPTETDTPAETAETTAQDWGSLEPETPEPAQATEAAAPAETTAEFEGSTARGIAGLFAGAAREAAAELGRGARAVGALARFAATGE